MIRPRTHTTDRPPPVVFYRLSSTLSHCAIVPVYHTSFAFAGRHPELCIYPKPQLRQPSVDQEYRIISLRSVEIVYFHYHDPPKIIISYLFLFHYHLLHDPLVVTKRLKRTAILMGFKSYLYNETWVTIAYEL